MNRREFMEAGAVLSVSGLGGPVVPEKDAHPIPPPPLAFRDHTSKLKITGVRMVRPQPRKPMPRYEPAPGSWSTGGALVANPMSIYPKYKARRDSFMADDLGPDAVEISTDKGSHHCPCRRQRLFTFRASHQLFAVPIEGNGNLARSPG